MIHSGKPYLERRDAEEALGAGRQKHTEGKWREKEANMRVFLESVALASYGCEGRSRPDHPTSLLSPSFYFSPSRALLCARSLSLSYFFMPARSVFLSLSLLSLSIESLFLPSLLTEEGIRALGSLRSARSLSGLSLFSPLPSEYRSTVRLVFFFISCI